MEESIFYFGDLMFKQKDGTVIGAPVANLCEGRPERTIIIKI